VVIIASGTAARYPVVLRRRLRDHAWFGGGGVEEEDGKRSRCRENESGYFSAAESMIRVERYPLFCYEALFIIWPLCSNEPFLQQQSRALRSSEASMLGAHRLESAARVPLHEGCFSFTAAG